MAFDKFSAQADKKLIDDIRRMAKNEGKYFSTLINEAFEDLIEKRKLGNPRRAVLEQFESSLEENASLYEKLAK
jgi:hypothetical protein